MRNLFMGLVLLAAGCVSNTKNMNIVSFPPVDRQPAQALKEFGFKDEHWTATNCNLNMEDFAVLELIRERARSSNPFSVFGETKPAETKAESKDEKTAIEKELEEAMASAGKQMSAQLAGSKYSGYELAKEKMANIKAEMAKLETAQLLEKAQKSERMDACTLTLSAYMQERYGFARKKGVYSKEMNEPMSLLEFIDLKNTVMRSREGTLHAYDWPTPEEVLESQHHLSDVSYRIGAITGGVDWGLRSAVDTNLSQQVEFRKGSAVVMFRGEPVQYRLATAMYMRPSDQRPFSAYVAPGERGALLFDDETLNGIDATGGESSFSSQSEDAAAFKVGKSEKERNMAEEISQCMRGFNPGRDVTSAKVVSFFNEKCRATKDQIALFVPVGIIKLPKENWNEVRSEDLLQKKYDKDVTVLSRYNYPSNGLAHKEYLRLSGHATDMDYMSSGILMVGDRAKFEEVAKATKINTPKLFKDFSKYAASGNIISFSKKDKTKFKQFVRGGGMEFFLALMAKDSDLVRLSFTQNLSNNRVEMVSLASLSGSIQESLAKSDKVTEAERAQILKSISRESSCAMQTVFLKQVLELSVDYGKRRTKAQTRADLQRISSVIDRAKITMESVCIAPIIALLNEAKKRI